MGAAGGVGRHTPRLVDRLLVGDRLGGADRASGLRRGELGAGCAGASRPGAWGTAAEPELGADRGRGMAARAGRGVQAALGRGWGGGVAAGRDRADPGGGLGAGSGPTGRHRLAHASRPGQAPTSSRPSQPTVRAADSRPAQCWRQTCRWIVGAGADSGLGQTAERHSPAHVSRPPRAKSWSARGRKFDRPRAPAARAGAGLAAGGRAAQSAGAAARAAAAGDAAVRLPDPGAPGRASPDGCAGLGRGGARAAAARGGADGAHRDSWARLPLPGRRG